jgi:hypothetical protein
MNGRQPGRPVGARTQGEDIREGVPSGKHARPSVSELARMAAISAFAAAFPALFKSLKESEVDKLERSLGNAIDEALDRLKEG